MEGELCNWISTVTKTEVKPETAHEQLLSGVVLCTLLNTIAPNTCKFNKMAKMPFIHRENILGFIQGIRKYGFLFVITQNSSKIRQKIANLFIFSKKKRCS